ncbi:hypothetical protein A2960_04755 [Candidatus Gottesmanbacteria bacterium RIFCSPLOWO2_01_FULL_39_12b]|uniref:Fimbrial assembly protein n=1 Tax=Candidatus Gottesmanbacteria bacterium RIFCSPLOWO2_01_FULL_39_12b TaxID=1798388 RepID=A0A1F6ANJ0_9BACT|nr:MAG: hypothetical protein A2960_04755 [Candidatus Gottesmanbacteria bacterium RIFCSPLOWO2_01_FULL_39_12b]
MPTQKRKLNINLVIKEESSESFSGQIISWAFTYGRYIIIITQIVVLSVFFLRFKLDRDHTDLKETVVQKQALIESVSNTEAEIRSIQTKLSHIRQLTTNQDAFLKVLRFFQENTPKDTVFLNLKITADKVSFKATAENLRSFNFFLRRLQQENKFKEVILDDIIRRPDGRIEFKIDTSIILKGFT